MLKVKYNLMIVDDSRVVYAEMKKLLEGSEFEIVSYCRSGEAALEEYGTVKPDVVTMDIVMPGIDGLETCQRLMEQWPDARILMVSSLAYGCTTENSAQLGAKGFLFKPFTQEELLTGLRKAMESE